MCEPNCNCPFCIEDSIKEKKIKTSQEKLETPRCFANIKSGDLYIVWYDVNAPEVNEESGWVEVSEKAWRVWSRTN